MKFKQALKEKKLDVEVGDTILVGKFKNRRTKIKGFDKDKNNQPTVETDKGERSLHKFRINKLMPKDKRKEED